MEKILSSVLLFLLALGVTTAQSITEEPEITDIMRRFEQSNRMNQEIRGWRVQIIATTDRRQVERERDKFEEAFPDYKVKYTHENPFYHLKTGAFLSQADARPFLHIIQEEFGSAFLVADDIEMAEVLLYQQ